MYQSRWQRCAGAVLERATLCGPHVVVGLRGGRTTWWRSTIPVCGSGWSLSGHRVRMRRDDGQGGGIYGAGNVVVTSVPAIAAHRRSTDGVGEVYASAQWDRPNLQRCPIPGRHVARAIAGRNAGRLARSATTRRSNGPPDACDVKHTATICACALRWHRFTSVARREHRREQDGRSHTNRSRLVPLERQSATSTRGSGSRRFRSVSGGCDADHVKLICGAGSGGG